MSSNNGGEEGPSPLIPLVMILVISFARNPLVISSKVMSIVAEFISSVTTSKEKAAEEEEDEEGGVSLGLFLVILLLILIGIHYFNELSLFFWGQRDGHGDEEEGYQLEIALFALLVFLLFKLFVQGEFSL